MNFVLIFIILFFLIYALFRHNIGKNNEKIENDVQSFVVKKYKNLNGKIILYPFIDSELNQHISPEKYDFIFCSFGLIILSKNYKPIITLYTQKAYHIKNIKINKCRLFEYKINSISNEIELQLSGIGHITKIKIIVKLNSEEKIEEISQLITALKND